MQFSFLRMLAFGAGLAGTFSLTFLQWGQEPPGSQVYFTPLGTGFGTCGAGNGCAAQAAQAGLN